MITSLVLNHERNILLLCLYELLEININLPSLGFIFFFSLLSVLLDIFHSTPSFFAIEFDLLDLVSARGTFLNLFRWLLLNILLDCLYTEAFTIIARNLLAFGSIEPIVLLQSVFALIGGTESWQALLFELICYLLTAHLLDLGFFFITCSLF